MTQIANLNTQLQGLSPVRSQRGDPGGPARHRDQPAFATDGCSGHDERQQPGFDLHQFRGSARRYAGVDAVVQWPCDAECLESLQHQSNPERCRHHHAHEPEWCDGRHGRDKRLQFRPDRGRSAVARHHAGAGTEAGRSTGRLDVERAIGHHDRRHRGDVRHAGRLHARSDRICSRATPSI